MSQQHERDSGGTEECWCCGNRFTPDELIHLGRHPEVALCTDCARWAHRRATELHDVRHRSLGAPVRAAVRRARNHVIARGWHERGALGRLLRRADRHLP